MPNWCDTEITFYSSDEGEISELREKLAKVFENSSHMRCYAEQLLPEIDTNNVKCRGIVIYIDEEISKTNNLYWFSMSTETAWSPQIGLWRDIIKKHFSSIKLAYIAEECGLELYEKWDESELFYPQKIRVSGFVPTKNGVIMLDEDERSYNSNFQEAKAWLQEVLPFEFTLTKSGDDLNEKLDEYIESHGLENGEEFWISFGFFEEYSPDKFEL